MEKDAKDTCWFKEPDKLKHDDIQYQKWFDGSLDAKNIKEIKAAGIIDFFYKILPKEICSNLGDTRLLSSLEIGYGGGRLINAASKIFKTSYGVDILSKDSVEKTKNFINSNNVFLLDIEEVEKIPNHSISFVYSFIVFQHFTKYSYFYDYLDLFDKKMSNTSYGSLFLSYNSKNDKPIFYDKDFEKRGCSMFYKPEFVCDEIKKRNFTPIAVLPTKKNIWSQVASNQFQVLFKRGNS